MNRQKSTLKASLQNQGFTIVETLVGLLLSTIILTGLIGAFLAVKSVNSMSLGYLQATQIVRGSIETLRGSAFASITDQGPTDIVYDSGPDLTWGTADDLAGELRVMVGDEADFDDDDQIAEEDIDVDGDGTNDVGYTRPVRVEFRWNQRVLGELRELSVMADTLITA